MPRPSEIEISTRMLDILCTGDDEVKIVIQDRGDHKVLYVHVNDVTALRIGKIRTGIVFNK